MGKPGVGIEDLGAGFAEHQDRHEHGDLAAGHDDHVVRVDGDVKATIKIRGDAFAQRQDAGRRRIAVMAVAQCLDRRLDDMLRGSEIGLPNAKIDDIASLCGKRGGTGEHGEGVFLADPVEALDGFQQIFLPGPRKPDVSAPSPF